MGVATRPDGFFGSISRAETRAVDFKRDRNRWRVVACVAIFFLAMIAAAALFGQTPVPKSGPLSFQPPPQQSGCGTLTAISVDPAFRARVSALRAKRPGEQLAPAKGVRPALMMPAVAWDAGLAPDVADFILDQVVNAWIYAPPGTDFCHDLVFYVRACEACPYSTRWSGAVGYAGQICGAHTIAYSAEDGFAYPITDQPPAVGRYKRAPAAAKTAQDAWDACFGPGQGTHWPYSPVYTSACQGQHPSGTLTYNAITLAQLPPGGQKNALCALYGCTDVAGCPGAGPTPSPSPTPTRTVPPGSSPTPTPVPIANPLAPWVEQFYREGFTAGCGPGPAYCPTAPVTREQMSVFILRAVHGPNYLPPPCSGVFTDVKCDAAAKVIKP